MSRRPTKNKQFGEYLKGLREAKTRSDGTPWKRSDAVRFAPEGSPLTYAILEALERGQTQDPDPEVLHVLAHIYDVPFTTILSRLIEIRYGVALSDLTRHASAIQQREQEAIDAIERARETQRRYEHLQGGLQRVADALSKVFAKHASQSAGVSPSRKKTRRT